MSSRALLKGGEITVRKKNWHDYDEVRDPICLEMACVEILWQMNLSSSDLKVNTVTSGWCLSGGFPFFFQLQLLRGDFFHNVQFTAKPCLNQQITTSLSFCCARLSGVMEMIWFMPTTYQPVRVIKSFDTHVLLEAGDDFAEWNYWESSGTLSASAPAICDEEDEEEDGEVQTQLKKSPDLQAEVPTVRVREKNDLRNQLKITRRARKRFYKKKKR